MDRFFVYIVAEGYFSRELGKMKLMWKILLGYEVLVILMIPFTKIFFTLKHFYFHVKSNYNCIIT